MKRIKWVAAIFGALLALALAGCGGAGTSAISVIATVAGGGVGTGGTGIVFGAITGFGSLVVDGKAYSSATPRYFADSDMSEAAAASAAVLALGNQVQMQLDSDGNPTSVTVEPALMGTVGSIGTNEFTVNGMTVRVNASAASAPLTYYSGLSDFASLKAGMRVAIHGNHGVDPASQQQYVQATLIEQLPGTGSAYRLSGLVSNLSASAATFQIGGTAVQFSGATSVLPAGISLANGLWVNVWSSTAPASKGELNANVIRVRTLAGTTGQAQVSGIVSKLLGTQFQLSGIAIDAGASALATTLRSLRAGDYVIAQGLPDAKAGTLVASSLRAYAAQPAQAELKGTITDLVSQTRFLVRGVPVDATGAQLIGAASTSLRNGMYVEVAGSVSGNAVTAKTLSAPGQAPKGGTVNYRGSISQYDAAKGTFVLTGSLDEEGASVTVKLAPSAAYENGGMMQLMNGASVEVEATKDSGDLLAYGVFFRKLGAMAGGMSGGKFESEGLAYGVTATTFNVNGLTIQINGVTPQGGSLTNGVKVEVAFAQSGGQNLAQQIAIDD
jgi:hypothetical protein